MTRCFVVLKNMTGVNADYPHCQVTTLEGVTETLYLAERMIENYYCSSGFGEEGRFLICSIAPSCTDERKYCISKHYGKDGVTTFTVIEKEINNDAAFI